VLAAADISPLRIDAVDAARRNTALAGVTAITWHYTKDKVRAAHIVIAGGGLERAARWPR